LVRERSPVQSRSSAPGLVVGVWLGRAEGLPATDAISISSRIVVLGVVGKS
jgi:hypothetical protein